MKGITPDKTVFFDFDSTLADTEPYHIYARDTVLALFGIHISDWGQYLGNYVDAEKYDVRNISASGITSYDLRRSFFGTAEYYGSNPFSDAIAAADRAGITASGIAALRLPVLALGASSSPNHSGRRS